MFKLATPPLPFLLTTLFHVQLPCHCLPVLPLTCRCSSGDKKAYSNPPSKGSALEIAEAYKKKKIEASKHSLHDDERHKAKKMTKLINSDYVKSSKRKLSPLPVSL